LAASSTIAADAPLPSLVTLSASAPGPLRLLKDNLMSPSKRFARSCKCNLACSDRPDLHRPVLSILEKPNRRFLGGVAAIVSFENIPVKVIPFGVRTDAALSLDLQIDMQFTD